MQCYTAKNYELSKTGLNNVLLPTLFNVVNNIVQHCYTRLQAGFRLKNLFSIVDNIEQCGQHNIVESCFQQPSTTRNFYARSLRPVRLAVCHSTQITVVYDVHLIIIS